jgi:hypothetical protein
MKGMLPLLLVASFIVPLFMLTSCSSATTVHELHMAPESALPAQLQAAPVRVREAYRFALANPDALLNVPCYCGCDALAHTSNYDCYIKDAPNNEQVVFEEHAIGCDICVDITQDVMRMMRQGRDPTKIRAEIVKTYSRFGPSNQ